MNWWMLAGAVGGLVVFALYLCLLVWSMVAMPPDDDGGDW